MLEDVALFNLETALIMVALHMAVHALQVDTVAAQQAVALIHHRQAVVAEVAATLHQEMVDAVIHHLVAAVVAVTHPLAVAQEAAADILVEVAAAADSLAVATVVAVVAAVAAVAATAVVAVTADVDNIFHERAYII